MILTVAIIPMVGMFDMGLKAATKGGDYDTARALANKKVEQAKSLPYDSASSSVTDVKDNFPLTAPTATTYNSSGATGTITGPSDATYPGFSYTVRKQHKCVSANNGSCTTPTGGTAHLTDSSTEKGIIQVTVTVTWASGNSYTTAGVVSKGTS
jgi:hypothetical protein